MHSYENFLSLLATNIIIGILLLQEAHVNTCYKHFYYFITEFDLVPQKEFEPLKDMTAKICHDTPEPAMNSEPKK